MNRFTVYEISDISEKSPIGEVLVKTDGALEFTPEPLSEHVERLRQALDAVGAEKALSLMSRESVGTGDDAKSVLTVRDVAAGDPLYPWAVGDALRRGYGFHYAPVPGADEDEGGEPEF